MKPFRKLLLFILAFVVIVAVADFISAILLNKIYIYNRYGMSGGNINYYLSKKQPEILIMGSSKAHEDLMPDSINKSAFNLSHHGMTIAFQAALADVLTQEKALPKKYLILQIEPEEMMEDAKDLYKDILYLKYYYNSNDFVKNEINKTGRFEFLKYYFSSYKFNGTFFSLVKNSINTKQNPPGNSNGFSGNELTKNDSALTMISTKMYLSNFSDHKIVFNDLNSKKNGLFYLSHIINICHAANVSLVIFTTPYFLNPTKEDKYMLDFDRYLEQNNIPFFDYCYEKMPALKDPHLWSDYAHLNIEGAKIFSHIFSEDFSKVGLDK